MKRKVWCSAFSVERWAAYSGKHRASPTISRSSRNGFRYHVRLRDDSMTVLVHSLRRWFLIERIYHVLYNSSVSKCEKTDKTTVSPAGVCVFVEDSLSTVETEDTCKKVVVAADTGKSTHRRVAAGAAAELGLVASAVNPPRRWAWVWPSARPSAAPSPADETEDQETYLMPLVMARSRKRVGVPLLSWHALLTR